MTPQRPSFLIAAPFTLALLFVCIASPSAAQLTASGNILVAADALGGVPGRNVLLGTPLAVGDFDGNGFRDLVVGAHKGPYVAYGSPSGLEPSTVAKLVTTTYPTGFAVGDFDGDRYDDLAVGLASWYLPGVGNAGLVMIFRGGVNGLSLTPARSIHQNTPTVGGAAEAGDEFGWAVTAGDFNGDGYDDLAVGVPGEDVGSVADSGAVQIFFGSRSGITLLGNLIFDQSGAFPGAVEAGDRLGASLAAADFDGDGYDELVVGAPGEGVGAAARAGALNVLPGTPTGPRLEGSYALTQGSGDETPENDDAFAATLAVGDFDGDGTPDLAVGSPGEDSEAGMVQVFVARDGALVGSFTQAFRQGHQIAGVAHEPGDRFGASLAVADFDLDGIADLAIGAPGEAIGQLARAGLIVVLYGSSGGVTASGAEVWWQGRDGVQGDPSPDKLFGDAIAAGDFDGGGPELAVGIPGEQVDGLASAGRLQIFRNGISGPPDTALVLSDRFRVSVEWRIANRSGYARDVLTSGDSGIFSFFDTANWEVMVKVLDACSFNGHFWVFFGGTTDVGFTLRVEDTKTGDVRLYSNPIGRTARTVTDTTAFPNCP